MTETEPHHPDDPVIDLGAERAHDVEGRELVEGGSEASSRNRE